MIDSTIKQYDNNTRLVNNYEQKWLLILYNKTKIPYVYGAQKNKNRHKNRHSVYIFFVYSILSSSLKYKLININTKN